MTADITNAILDAQGQVAMRYMKQAPALVKCNGHDYYFATKASISLCFVDPADVDCLLGVRESCNCQNGAGKKQMIFLADETHTRRWINGGGR